MDEYEMRVVRAVEGTHVVRHPRQSLATFGTTSVRYYLVTEPAYADPSVPAGESVVREGTVRAERPRVVTPQYLLRHEGFGEHAGDYLRWLAEELGQDAPGLLYSYHNDGMETAIVSGSPDEVAARIAERLDREDRGLAAVVRGVDELWDASLMKFIYELTASSVRSNAAELGARGLLDVEDGVPREARQQIERLLARARDGDVDPSTVHRELDRWGLFEEYQDRFLALFRGRS